MTKLAGLRARASPLTLSLPHVSRDRATVAQPVLRGTATYYEFKEAHSAIFSLFMESILR